MFNESKLWRSLEHRRNYKRKQVEARNNKKKKTKTHVTELRKAERRPAYKRIRFTPHRYDRKTYKRLELVLGTESARAYYHRSSGGKKNEFWWEKNFDHNRYVTSFGRSVLRKAKEEKEQKVRTEFKLFLSKVDDVRHLKSWVDHFDGLGTYDDCFKEYSESDSDSDSSIDCDDLLNGIDYEKVIPVATQSKILSLSKEWTPNTIPNACPVVKDTCSSSESEVGKEEESDSGSEEEFDAGF